jgi:hypothetical protein
MRLGAHHDVTIPVETRRLAETGKVMGVVNAFQEFK